MVIAESETEWATRTHLRGAATPGTAPEAAPRHHVSLIDLIAVDLDPSDLTPRPVRVVHARVVKERDS